MKRPSLLFISLFLPFLLHAQKISWNRTFRLKEDSTHFFLGEKNGQLYFLHKNRLIKYSEDYNKIAKFKLEGLYEVGYQLKAAFILNDEIVLVRKEEVIGLAHLLTTRISATSYDFEGKLRKKETVLYAQTDNQWNLLGNRGLFDCEEGFAAPSRIEVSYSANNEYIGLHYVSNSADTKRSDEFIVVNANNFGRVSQTSFKAEDRLQCFVLSDGGFLTLKGDDIFGEDCPPVTDPITLTLYSSTSSIKKQFALPIKANKEEFRSGLFYKLDEYNNALYILINLAKYKPEDCNIHPSRHETATIQFEKINLGELQPVFSKFIHINEKTISLAGMQPLLGGRIQGLPYLEIMDLKENGNEVFVFAQIRYSNTLMYAPHGLQFSHQIIFKESLVNDESFQKVNKARAQSLYPAYGIIFHNKNIYLLYYRERIWKRELNMVKLDENLEEKNKMVIRPRRFLHKIYLNPYQYYRMGENKYILFGNLNKRVGSATLELE